MIEILPGSDNGQEFLKRVVAFRQARFGGRSEIARNDVWGRRTGNSSEVSSAAEIGCGIYFSRLAEKRIAASRVLRDWPCGMAVVASFGVDDVTPQSDQGRI